MQPLLFKNVTKNVIVMLMRIGNFNIWEGNPNSRLSEINIVGKTIKYLRLDKNAYPFFDRVPEDACYLKIEANLYICFEDGDVLEVSAWDETFTVSYNYYSDYPEFKDEKPDPIIDSVINKYVSGKKISDSTFCGEECYGNYMYLTIELKNGVEIRLEATSQDTLDIALFRNHEDSWAEEYIRGSFNRKKLKEMCRKQMES